MSPSIAGLPADLVDGLGVCATSPVHGGDIATALRLETADGPLFLKWLANPSPGLFEREASGLRVLAAHRPQNLRVPRVVREHRQGLVLEWIPQGPRSDATEAELGRGLAGLHRASNETFGAVDSSLAGYLGSAPVDLTPTTTWSEFFVHRRVLPLVARAVEMGRINPDALALAERLAVRADELCGPPERPALLHGDLWAGNRLVDSGGVNWLIDPACHWGHREYDLAMMHLFGGFGPECFAAYDEAFALAPGWQERVDWYQVPPLLVHAILFGGGYGASAMRALARYR
ncbi:MAG: fructosamine kinase family protein [Actinomycetales bacterium]